MYAARSFSPLPAHWAVYPLGGGQGVRVIPYSGVDLGGELSLRDGETLVRNLDHAVDLRFTDHQWRREVHHVPDSGHQPSLQGQLPKARRERRGLTPALARLLVLDEIDGVHQPKAAHVANGGMGA